jgi:MerR family mercuric resistance operon transcriptional regulator
MRIGQIAAQAGVNIDTVRYYERRGLLDEPAREPSSGYRAFSPETVRVIRFIKRAQDLGFTLGEVKDLLRLREDRTASCAEVRASARAKIAAIDVKLRDLQRMKRALTLRVGSCTRNGSTRQCPILEALDQALPKGPA